MAQPIRHTEPPATRPTSDETAPLLAKHRNQPNPLPKLQLAVIYAIKLTLPIATTQALPYYNVFIEKLAASEGADTGYYSGLANSVASITQFTSMFVWGALSDHHGRIPVILLGTTGTAFFTLLFGLSGSLTSVLINRFLGGFFFGITGAIHSVVGELSDETNQSIAFPLYDVISALGYVIGPLIGGTFAEPAKHWPDVFSSSFWSQYPYALPCLISAILSLAAAFLAAFVLEETLPGKRKSPHASGIAVVSIVEEEQESLIAAASSTDTVIDIQTEEPKRPLFRELLSIPVLQAVFASSAALGFAGSCFNSVFVLMAYSPINEGGLALSPSQIGRALSGMGAVSIVLKLGMPALLRRFGTLAMFDFCMYAWIAAFAALPLASWVARGAAAALPPNGAGLRDAGTGEWLSISFVLFLSRLGCLAFSIIMILTKDHTPGTTSLGTANGLAELFQSIAAALGPITVSSLFAISAKKHLLGGYLWVVLLVLESGFGAWVAGRIRRYRD
ncbi:MFS general substrate transporter [Ganoderma sinense ZZ0214-1]|uniref:MFS general substrate transporter n=1 Tax=Ganoderma sinense ZZ0214-1 TaxID=1077348 RepID=A0A2G8SQ66_9APHY|nr:MFS general substrate transporter [Ganoderma sinense ZZ0214-1]